MGTLASALARILHPSRRAHGPSLRRRTSAGLALTLVVVFGACATRGQVEAIVAESNAALVGSYVDVPGQSTPDWAEAVRDLDRFIDAHPGNATLVNHLRVRQAMLLTANGSQNLADQYWGLVEREALDSDRDRALTDVGTHLSWWYDVAPGRDRLSADDAAAARAALTSTVSTTPEGSDVRTYLATILAQLEVRMARDSRLSPPESELPAALERYIDTLGADSTWITGLEGLTDQDLQSARQLKAFRYRIWLDEMIAAYKRVADDLMLDDPIQWRPGWVNRVD